MKSSNPPPPPSPLSPPPTTTHTHMQHDLANSLILMLNTREATHSIEFQGVYPTDPYVMVEFYAINERTKEPLNATHAYEMLTTKGQDYYFARFHIIRVEMKGMTSNDDQLVSDTHGCVYTHLWVSDTI